MWLKKYFVIVILLSVAHVCFTNRQTLKSLKSRLLTVDEAQSFRNNVRSTSFVPQFGLQNAFRQISTHIPSFIPNLKNSLTGLIKNQTKGNEKKNEPTQDAITPVSTSTSTQVPLSNQQYVYAYVYPYNVQLLQQQGFVGNAGWNDYYPYQYVQPYNPYIFHGQPTYDYNNYGFYPQQLPSVTHDINIHTGTSDPINISNNLNRIKPSTQNDTLNLDNSDITVTDYLGSEEDESVGLEDKPILKSTELPYFTKHQLNNHLRDSPAPINGQHSFLHEKQNIKGPYINY